VIQKAIRNFTLSFLYAVPKNRQIIIPLRLETLKGFEYRRTGFGEEERRKKKGEKKNFDQPKKDKKKKAHR